MKMLKGEQVETNKYKQNGITLIALVVTVVVLLILAGISIGVLAGEDGIIEKAKEAAFKSEIKGYQETAYLYIASKTALEDGPDEYIVNSRNAETNPNSKFEEEFKTELNNTEFEEVFKKLKSGYTDKICIYNNEFYYIPISEEKKIQQEIKWCFEVSVKVWGYESYDEYISDVNVPKGEYIEKNGIYLCEPDLSQFNKEQTHYVTYDESGNETISKSIKVTPEPEDWYDYNNNKWANIVTISGDKKAYWVWIPRYVYMLDQEAQTQKQVKIKFVDTQDYYTDFVTKQKTQYPDREPQFDENGYQTNYCLPEAFTWDRGGEAERELPGYWVSKYEISDMDVDIELLFSMNKNSITIEKVDTSKAYMTPASYDIYLDGNLLKNISSFPYTISGLATNKEYKIRAIAKTSTGEIIGNIDEELVKTTEKEIPELTVPDLTGYDQEKTFYVQYNGDTVESEDVPISQAAPSDWYDYSANKWANIATVNEDISNNKDIFENAKAYWVWIPRYEYKVKKMGQVQIRFISKEQTTPTEGYKIPEAFTWDETQLSGYWVSKYEITEANEDKGQFYFTSENNAIDIKEVKIYDASASAATKYDIYVNNVLRAYEVAIPYTITGLSADTQYRIKAVAKTSDGKKIGMIQEEYVKTAQADIATIISPDLTGFNTATTYYVTYDDSGNETRTPITSAAPSDWYDYNNSKWANIVTSNNGKEAYFVWIPRYEYKPKDKVQKVQLRFITKDITTPTTGWKIPDAFTWDGNPISGYWVSKYEISESE